MLSVTRVEARAYSRATEVLDRVKTAVLNLYPPTSRENIEITTTKTTSYTKLPIIIIKAITQKKQSAVEMFDYMLANLSKEDKIVLKNTLHQRISEKCVLFVRIDKQAAFLGRIRLADKPDLVSIKVYVTMYPRCNRDTMIANIIKQLNTDGE
jgi:RNA binding exosome subunit